MRILLMTIIFAIVASSCKHGKIVSDISTSKVRDSVNVTKTQKKDSIVYVKGDSVKIVQYIECDDKTNMPIPSTHTAKKGNTLLKSSIDKNGKQTIVSQCDSIREVNKELLVTISRQHSEVKDRVVTKEVYKTRTIDIICRWICGLILSSLIGYTAFRIWKPKFI